MRRLATASAVVLVFAGALPQTSWAHATLVSSSPSYGEVLAHAPREIRLLFNDTIRPASGNAAVSNATGRSILAGSPRVQSSRELVLPLTPGLPRGNYTARWRVISDDGHTEEGLLAFGVGSGGAPPTAGLPLLGTGFGVTNFFGRWVFLLGVLVSLGIVTFVAFVWRPAVRAAGLDREADVSAREERVTSIVLFTSFLLCQLGSVLAILHATTATRYGRVHELAIVFAGIGAAATATPSRPLRLLTGIAAVGLATTPSLAGHALDPGEPQPLSFVADLLHVWAAGVWIGGLVALALALRAARSLDPEPRQRLTSAVARRFSRLALLSVAVIAATGLARALVELRSVHQLWSLGYGRAILVKTGLLAGVLVVAWLNRSRLLPQLSRDHAGEASWRLRLGALAEVAVLVGVLAAVSVLTDLRPGRSVEQPTRAGTSATTR